MFLDVLSTSIDVLLTGIEIFLEICLLVVTIFMTFIVPILIYLPDRIWNDEWGKGFVSLLTIIPKFLGIINVFCSVCFILNLCQLRHPENIPSNIKALFLKINAMDYLIWVIIFVSIIILIELIRFIEYKVCFSTEEVIIYADDLHVNGTEQYFIYNEKRVEIVKVNNDNVISLAIEPTLHGQDSIYGKNVEYIIKNIEARIHDHQLFLVPKNPVKYSFTKI